MAKCFVAAGGTGGHIFPAMAVAEQLQASGFEVHWIGGRGRLEEKVVPQHYPLHRLKVKALRGKGKLAALMAPVRLLQSLWQACRLIHRHRPRFVLAMGGYVCGPIGLAAWMMRVPLILHEQNAAAGLTNRCLQPLAARVMQAFAGSFPSGNDSIEAVGNPVRQAFWQIAQPQQRFDKVQPQLRLLVVGGSQGARFINQRVPELLLALNEHIDVECWHQTGALDYDAVQESYKASALSVRAEAFVDDMAEAYAWADVVLCRAGALTVSEVAAAGVAAVFVPLPIAVDDHQRKNAEVLVDAGAAEMVLQSEWDQSALAKLLVSWQLDRTMLLKRAQAAKTVAMPDAARHVADACMACVKGKSGVIEE